MSNFLQSAACAKGAFYGDPAVKAKYIARIKAHMAADAILQNYGYWKGGKGCAVGCTLNGEDHQAYEDELGIPESIAHLEDRIFEDVPVAEAKSFPLEFLEVIEVGADLSLVPSAMMLVILEDAEIGVLNKLEAGSDAYQATETVINLYKRRLVGDEPTVGEWIDAVYAASAASAAAASYAASYASYAVSYAASEQEFYSKLKNKFLELLANPPQLQSYQA